MNSRNNSQTNSVPDFNTQSQHIQDLQLTTLSQDSFEYPFFYNIPNDFQIYHVICKEISNELVNITFHNQTNLHVFYYQLEPNEPDDKIYQIICEMVSPSLIVRFLNKNIFGVELKHNRDHQQEAYLDFSDEQKGKLEFHLKQFLFNYLTTKQINEELSNKNMIKQDDNTADIISQSQKKFLNKL